MSVQEDVYIRLFHGRNSPDEQMEDWGFDGPTLGPFRYVHITYMSDIKISMERDAFHAAFPAIVADYQAAPNDPRLWVEHRLNIIGDLIEYDGKFYGDFSVINQPQPRFKAGDPLIWSYEGFHLPTVFIADDEGWARVRTGYGSEVTVRYSRLQLRAAPAPRP